MRFKTFCTHMLFPPIALMLFLIPVSICFLVYCMVFVGTETPLAIVSYVISAYTLTVWCFRIPRLLEFFKKFKRENKYAKRWLEDTRLRVNASLYSSLILNFAFAVFQLFLGIFHASFWFYSLAGYYLSLAAMRYFLVRYTAKKKPGENVVEELHRYRICGLVFLLMNIILSLIIFFMIYFGRTFRHHEITTITIAAFTFTAFTLAIINVVKYRKYNSPAYSAAKAISLASACVSMLTLESTMLTTFGGTDALMRKLFLSISGGVVSAFILFLACYMIIESNKKIKHIQETDDTNGK